MGDMLLTDSLKAQKDVTVSRHSPLGLKRGFKTGPKRDQATFWSEQDSRVRSKQKRPGQSKAKTFGEDGKEG